MQNKHSMTNLQIEIEMSWKKLTEKDDKKLKRSSEMKRIVINADNSLGRETNSAKK